MRIVLATILAVVGSVAGHQLAALGGGGLAEAQALGLVCGVGVGALYDRLARDGRPGRAG